jgi:hypothetical protein
MMVVEVGSGLVLHTARCLCRSGGWSTETRLSGGGELLV